jgi:hypothetical protein
MVERTWSDLARKVAESKFDCFSPNTRGHIDLEELGLKRTDLEELGLAENEDEVMALFFDVPHQAKPSLHEEMTLLMEHIPRRLGQGWRNASKGFLRFTKPLTGQIDARPSGLNRPPTKRQKLSEAAARSLEKGRRILAEAIYPLDGAAKMGYTRVILVAGTQAKMFEIFAFWFDLSLSMGPIGWRDSFGCLRGWLTRDSEGFRYVRGKNANGFLPLASCFFGGRDEPAEDVPEEWSHIAWRLTPRGWRIARFGTKDNRLLPSLRRLFPGQKCIVLPRDQHPSGLAKGSLGT